MLEAFLSAAGATFVALFPIVNPLGNLPVFLSLTEGDSRALRRRQAIMTAVYVVAILVTFLFVGRLLLNLFGITLGALEIAGGLIVAHTAWGMLTSQPGISEDEHAAGRAKDDVSFTPMAMPLLAGPGAIGVVVGLATRNDDWTAYPGQALGIVAMALLALAVLLLGEPLSRRLGPNGIGALTRVFGFLILAIAVELVSHGVQELS